VSDPIFPYTDRAVTDNGYLESCSMQLPGVVRSEADVQKVLERYSKVTMHGHRHSQGGQTLKEGAAALDVDLLQEIQVNEQNSAAATVTIGGGATWDHLHRNLATRTGSRFAPITHQSSPFFSVGGSLSVNCHGRDPRQGPVSASVNELTVMHASGKTAKYQPKDEEFKAVLGGYGACGVILRANLNLKPEKLLKMVQARVALEKYNTNWIVNLADPKWVTMMHHYAWLSCGDNSSLFNEVCYTDGVEINGYINASKLSEESILTDDMLSVVYRAYRIKPLADKFASWEQLIDQVTVLSNGRVRQLNAMRSPVRFMQAVPQAEGKNVLELDVDLMQEYFVPPEEFLGFVKVAKKILEAAQEAGTLIVQSCTVRSMKQDDVTLLSYARPGPRISVVINFSTSPANAAGCYTDSGNLLRKAMSDLIDAAIAAKGAFYLCYGRFATKDQFEAAYDPYRIKRFKEVRRALDPQRKFDSRFLQHFLPD
jgi:decaprenylphospho-beta-D-ribofuranose 2-oxidase